MVERSPRIQEGGLEQVPSAPRPRAGKASHRLPRQSLLKAKGSPRVGWWLPRCLVGTQACPFPSVAVFVPNPFHPGVTRRQDAIATVV